MSDVIERFQQFEERNGFLLDEVDGFRYWAYVRFSLYMQIEDILNEQMRPMSKNPRPNVKEMLSIIRNLTINNPLWYRKHKDILFFTHARRSLVEGRYECLYTDKLAEEFSDESISGEFIYGTKHFEPVYTKELLELDVIDIWPAIKYKILNRYYRKKDGQVIAQLNEIGKQISSKISEVFDVCISESLISHMLIKRYYWHKMKKKMLRKLIVNISPKLIVEVVGYETNKLIVNEIATELNIHTVELQHGVIGRGHLAYNYQVMRNYPFLPQYIFMFAQYWKDECRFPIDNDKKIITGFPYMESQMIKYPQNENKLKRPINILILSQPEFSKKLKKFIANSVTKAKEDGLEVQFVYKLHPSEYNLPKETWECFEEYDNVSIINNGNVALYSLFAQADIQIGVTSTAIFEGLAYRLKTYIYHIEKTDTYMGKLIDYGEAEFVETADELIDKIRIYELDKQGDESNRLFFVKEALSNMKCEIERIKDEN